MIRHLFKMVWNRKKWNILIILEIFLSFLVLFAVSVSAIKLYNNQKNALGFDYKDVWLLTMSEPSGAMDKENKEETISHYKQIQHFLKNQEPIQDFGLMNTPPYRNSNWITSLHFETVSKVSNLSYTTLGLYQSLDLDISEGRWFEERDFLRSEGAMPIVINNLLAKELFGTATAAIGQKLYDDDDESKRNEFQVIGVLRHFRKEGELKKPLKFGMLPLRLDSKTSWLPNYGLLEMHSGANMAFEEHLLKSLNRIAPNWSFKVQSLSRERDVYFAKETQALKVTALVAFFLILMVAMGLIGVLWQHVTRRTIELGVRRAKGATKYQIYNQIVGEFLIIATIAVSLGLLCLIQLPFLGLFKQTELSVFVPSFLISGIAIYVLTILASFYPGWMASRIMPAEALHYE